MSRLRKVAAIALPAKIERPKSFGKRPEWRWVAPTELLIDKLYQRDVSDRSHRMLLRMCEGFAWNRMKPPIVVEVASGLHIIDGQHTAIAAASLGIEKIPIVIVEAGQERDRAYAFIGHNTDRVKVTDLQIHAAKLAAGDADAVDVDNVCRRAGVTFRIFTNGAEIGRGETMALGAISKIVKRRGVMRARQVLELLVKADCRPIIAPQVFAVDRLYCDDRMPVSALIDVISNFTDRDMIRARAKSATERVTLWQTLIATWAARAKEAA